MAEQNNRKFVPWLIFIPLLSFLLGIIFWVANSALEAKTMTAELKNQVTGDISQIKTDIGWIKEKLNK